MKIMALRMAMLALLMAPVMAAATPAQTYNELFRAAGIDSAYARFPESIADSLPQMGVPDAQRAAWERAAFLAFDSGVILEQMIAYLSASQDFAAFQGAAAFLDSPLGLRMTALENDAMVQPNADAEGEAIIATLMAENPARLNILRQMVDDTDLVEMSVASALSMNLAVMSGMKASRLLPYDIDEAQMMALLDERRPVIRTQIERAYLVRAAYTYRNISDDDLNAYLAFLTGPTGRQLYAAINTASTTVLIGRARHFGALMAEFMAASDL